MRSLKDHVSRMINNLGAYKRALSLLLEDEYVLSFMNLSIFRYVRTYFNIILFGVILILLG